MFRCANCHEPIGIPRSPDARCSRCGKSPLDIGDWAQIKELRKPVTWWNRIWGN